MIAIKAGAVYFAIVFAVGFALGAFRGLLVAPQLGETGALILELPVILTVSWFASRWVNARFTVPARLLMGGAAFVLLIVAELVLAMAGFGRTFVEFFASYTEFNGALGLAGQIVFAAFPTVQLRWK